MKKMLKQFGLSLLLIIQLIGGMTPHLVRAQLFNSTAGTGVNPQRCQRDYGTFLSSVIGMDDFMEYWKDILYRYTANICIYQDIEAIRQRITKVREQIRKAFYVCADTSKLTDTYHKLEAELYYLRKFVDFRNGTFYEMPEDQVYASLKSFLGDKYGEDDIKKFYDGFKQKYQSKLKGYKECKDPTWSQLSKKWDEFTDSIAGLSNEIEKAGEDIEKRWKRMANTPLNLNRDFIGDIVTARVNGLEPKQGLEQIKAEFEKNYPQGYTFDQLQAATVLEEQRYDSQKLEQDYLSQYQTLYGNTKDVYTGEIIARLDLLNKIIVATYPFENKTTQCLKTIKDKQC